MVFKVTLIGFLFCLFNLVVAVRGDYSDLAIAILATCMLINYVLLLNEILT